MLIDILVGAYKSIGNGALGGDDGTPEDLGSHRWLPFAWTGMVSGGRDGRMIVKHDGSIGNPGG